MGCKPFYYYNDDRVFVFASDIEGILACSWVPQRLINHYGLKVHSLED